MPPLFLYGDSVVLVHKHHWERFEDDADILLLYALHLEENYNDSI